MATRCHGIGFRFLGSWAEQYALRAVRRVNQDMVEQPPDVLISLDGAEERGARPGHGAEGIAIGRGAGREPRMVPGHSDQLQRADGGARGRRGIGRDRGTQVGQDRRVGVPSGS